MIPTLILAGLLVGRWWMLAVAAVAWPAYLILTQRGTGLAFALTAAAIAIPNAAVGVAVHRAVRAVVRCAQARTCRSTPKTTDEIGSSAVTTKRDQP